jgi:prepilin-type N-terminal cleavage/methylation domain-containing protein
MRDMMKTMETREQGYTLIELIVVIAIVGFIAGVMAIMFNVVSKVSVTSTGQNIVLSQIQQSGTWVTRDIISAENVTLYTSGNRLCRISRYQWNGTDNISTVFVDYDIIGGKLLRTVEPGNPQIIAQFISPHHAGTDLVASTALSENNTYIFTVQANYNNSIYSRVYKMNQRIP